jgi:tetratricopeptide (TPR) repeat protein
MRAFLRFFPALHRAWVYALQYGMPSIAQLEKLLATDPHDPFVLYGLAQKYAKAGQTQMAVAFYDRCLQADPAYCYAYYHKARALSAAGDMHAAGETIQAGILAAKNHKDSQALGELSALADELEVT